MASRQKERGKDMKRNWSVTVVYEDTPTRESAVKFCDLLVKRFWSQSEFSINWWGFSQLEDSTTAQEAQDKAAEADLIIFAAQPETEFSDPLEHWIETWLSRRGEREGALIGLNDPCAAVGSAVPGKFCYLRNVAHRAGMDYLTNLPEELRAIPDSPESCSERARQVTHVLDDILRRRTLPRGSVI